MRRISYILLLGILLSACQKNTKSEGTNLPVEVISPIKETETGRNREYTFLSRPHNETVLSFRINGPVLNFELRPGQAFSKGSTILSIDNRDFLIRKQQTEALYSQASQEYQRIEALYKKNNISGSNYEKAKADFLVAKSNYETAVNALSDTHLAAPYNGYIQDIHIEPFQDVKATEPILTFIELDRLKIETYIPEEVALHLYDKEKQERCKIGIHFDTAPERAIAPSDLYVSKSTTNNNLSYLLTAIIPNPDMEWLGGMSGVLSISLPEEERSENLWLPLTAICHRPQKGDYVWVAKGDKVNSVPVELGEQRNNQIEIVEGITETDLVVLTRQRFLSENSTVTIQK
ncbi:MAG: efflux RND transporter periplasmic adaptor subunit [Parabacteroides sp.]|nr:efflux RND transporter periplasmic adaptor subunit [Parabacteroides sp.]